MIVSRDQNSGRRHSTEIDNSSSEGRRIVQIFGNKITNQNSTKEDIQTEIKQCSLPFGAESFVFLFAIQKYKNSDIQNYNFSFCFFICVKLGL